MDANKSVTKTTRTVGDFWNMSVGEKSYSEVKFSPISSFQDNPHRIGHMDGPSISDRIIYAIVKYIKMEGLAPGDKLPSEKELGDLLGVGNRALRESLMILRSTGLLQAHSGRGWYVDRFNPVQSLRFMTPLFQEFSGANIDHIMETRIANEPMIARLAAQNISEEALIQLEKTFETMQKCDSNEHKEEFRNNDILFHEILAQQCGNCIQAMFSSVLHGLTFMAQWKLPDENNNQNILQQHQEILEAIQKRDPVRAETAMQMHLEEAWNFIKSRI